MQYIVQEIHCPESAIQVEEESPKSAAHIFLSEEKWEYNEDEEQIVLDVIYDDGESHSYFLCIYREQYDDQMYPVSGEWEVTQVSGEYVRYGF